MKILIACILITINIISFAQNKSTQNSYEIKLLIMCKSDAMLDNLANSYSWNMYRMYQHSKFDVVAQFLVDSQKGKNPRVWCERVGKKVSSLPAQNEFEMLGSAIEFANSKNTYYWYKSKKESLYTIFIKN